MKPIINYKEHNKVRIRNSDKSFLVHEVVKLLIMSLSQNKHKDAGIYSEHILVNGDIVDVFIDLGKDQVYYEIQKEISKNWLDSIKQRDLELNINTQVIKLKELSNNLDELIIQLENLIV